MDSKTTFDEVEEDYIESSTDQENGITIKMNAIFQILFYRVALGHRNTPLTIPDEEKKLNSAFIFTLLCGASKVFIKATKDFIKPLEAQQRCMKIKL